MIALLSVYNKEGIVEFARELKMIGWDLLSSGGTADVIRKAGIVVKDTAEVAGGGAILGHKVVTLSREIHAGLLASEDERGQLEAMGIPWIDMVCIDMYPLTDEIAKEGATRDTVRDKTDIGGPTMLRSAAKGRRIVICDPADRMRVIGWLKNDRPAEAEFITDLVAKAEFTVANYVMASAEYHGDGRYFGFAGERRAFCKYGENAWQTPAFLYSRQISDSLALDRFELVAGTAPSYNNWTDIDRMLQTMTHIAVGFEQNYDVFPMIAVAVKHGNACGAAYGSDPVEVVRRAVEGDQRAIFGGLVMTNIAIGQDVIEALLTWKMPEGQRRLLDGIIAPRFSSSIPDLTKRKNDKCRLLANPELECLERHNIDEMTRFRFVRGGFLVQPNYAYILDLSDPELVRYGELQNPEMEKDLVLAWAIGSTSNSNTVTLVKDGMLIGNGVGQQDRVGGCELAIKRARDAGHDTEGAVAYSDSFFPFEDGPRALHEAGIAAVLASSGSVKDKEIAEACEGWGMTLIHIPDAKARGFFGH